MNDERRAFAVKCYHAALAACGEPWRARWMAAIACHESGWGRYVPRASNNPIGYHWISGRGWPYVETTEGGTGRKQRYRKFASLEECFTSLDYLIRESRIEGYAEAREHFASCLEGIRKGWIVDFSLGFCPVDPGHGVSVAQIYTALEGVEDETPNADFAAGDDGVVERLHQA